MNKPVKRYFHDGEAHCASENYAWNEAFCVVVDCPSLYSASEVRKVIRFLERAEKWIANKELYKKRGPKPKDKDVES